MKMTDMLKWNKRASAVYALGIWTMIGSYGFLKYTGRLDDTPANKEEEVPEVKDPNEFLYETTHCKTVITYKKDFVPYTTRIYSFIKSLSGTPEDGDSEK